MPITLPAIHETRSAATSSWPFRWSVKLATETACHPLRTFFLQPSQGSVCLGTRLQEPTSCRSPDTCCTGAPSSCGHVRPRPVRPPPPRLKLFAKRNASAVMRVDTIGFTMYLGQKFRSFGVRLSPARFSHHHFSRTEMRPAPNALSQLERSPLMTSVRLPASVAFQLKPDLNNSSCLCLDTTVVSLKCRHQVLCRHQWLVFTCPQAASKASRLRGMLVLPGPPGPNTALTSDLSLARQDWFHSCRGDCQKGMPNIGDHLQANSTQPHVLAMTLNMVQGGHTLPTTFREPQTLHHHWVRDRCVRGQCSDNCQFYRGLEGEKITRRHLRTTLHNCPRKP